MKILFIIAIILIIVGVYLSFNENFKSEIEKQLDDIDRKKKARLKFDRNNINPNLHSTHYACKEIINLYGDKSKGCCDTGHICKR